MIIKEGRAAISPPTLSPFFFYCRQSYLHVKIVHPLSTDTVTVCLFVDSVQILEKKTNNNLMAAYRK